MMRAFPGLRRFSVAVLVCACAALVPVLFAEESPKAAILQDILDRIHQHAATDAWRQQGWKEEAIEAWLDGATAAIRKAAQRPNLKLPVRIADVAPTDFTTEAAADRVIVVGNNITLSRRNLRNSIVLADGNVEVGNIDHCVVIARGVVTAKQSTESVIV